MASELARRQPCKFCPAMIILARTENARPMPLDEPDPEGNCAVRDDGKGNVYVRVLRKGEEPLGYETRWRPHWATCASPPERRRQQRGQWAAATSKHNRDKRTRRAWRQPRTTPDRAGQLRLLPPEETR